MDALDMPLDSLVKKSKISARGGGGGIRAKRGGGGGGRGRVSGRLAQNRGVIGGFLAPRTSNLFRKFRPSGPFGSVSKPNRGAATTALWQQQNPVDEGARLYVSNLDNGVSNEDIKELFGEIGELKYCTIHYDQRGRSKGTAEVFFFRREHAVMAKQQYNNVQLDGKPMVIDFIGGGPQLAQGFNVSPVVPRQQRPFVNPIVPRTQLAPGIRRPRDARPAAARGRGRGGALGGGRGRGRGRGGRLTSAPQKTVDELNAELDKYHNQAMDTA